MSTRNDGKGISLAKGPVGLIGLALLAYGVIAFILGANGFNGINPVSGNTNGQTFLGIEANGWSAALFAAAGLLLLFGSPFHWGAKSTAIIVGLVLGAASVISMVDGKDVFGIFAANGGTMLVWGVAAAALLLLSLLPRVGKARDGDRAHGDREVVRERTVVVPERSGRFTSDRDVDAVGTERRVVAPADRDRL